MGLFSKKTLVCESCGKEYEARITLGIYLCSECLRRQNQKSADVKGYVDYAMEMSMGTYSENKMDEILIHREQILEKYRMVNGITRAELQNASDNYRKLSDAEAADILVRCSRSSIGSTVGAAYTGYFFVPTAFEKTIVDAQDVFAVGYTSDQKNKIDGNEIILCAVFTNDPYIPVFPMTYVGKLGFFDFAKSKKGRQGVGDLFEGMCPNLTYPVQDLKQLKKQINSDGVIHGNIDKQFMLNRISDASKSTGIFNTKKLFSNLDAATAAMLDSYGYIQEHQINEILKFDKMFNRNFWEKQMKKLLK